MSDKEESNYNKIANELADLVTEKNKAYGDAVGQSEEFLRLLYPDGISIKDYSNMLTVVRVWDKLKRIATDEKAFNEEPWKDILGYCLLKIDALNKKEMDLLF